MIVKKEKVKVVKPKVKTRVTVDIAKVNKAIDAIDEALHYVQYGYTVNPKIEELRKLFK